MNTSEPILKPMPSVRFRRPRKRRKLHHVALGSTYIPSDGEYRRGLVDVQVFSGRKVLNLPDGTLVDARVGQRERRKQK